MEDYKQTMRDLLLQYYTATPPGKNTEMHTADLLRWFRGIIPIDPITEHDVFEVMKELGFKNSQKILTEQVCTNFKLVEQLNHEPEFDTIEIDRILVWDLYDKE